MSKDASLLLEDPARLLLSLMKHDSNTPENPEWFFRRQVFLVFRPWIADFGCATIDVMVENSPERVSFGGVALLRVDGKSECV